MVSNAAIKLKIPKQDLQQFSLFELDEGAARDWAQSLPVANTQSVVQQLRHALSDLNHVEMSPENRYLIIESLRPSLLVALSNLQRRYLNQPLVMPEEPRQMAEIAGSLCDLAATAYSIVAIHAIQQRDSIRNTNPARLAAEAIHRALLFSGHKLLLTFQLHRPVELHGWLTLHQLYALAEAQGLQKLPINEPLGGARTIAGNYVQALLLGCCKPNQLRQSDLAAVYRGLQDWAELVQLRQPPDAEGIFLVNIDSDQPPLYSSLYNEPQNPQCRYVDTRALIRHLEDLLQAEGGKDITFGKDLRLTGNTVEHIIKALGSMSLRNFKRVSSPHPLWISIGLSAAHYHLAGERVFERLLYGDQYLPPAASRVATNPFLQHQERGDLWQQANPEEDFSPQEHYNQTEAAVDLEHRIDLDKETQKELLGEDAEQLSPEERYPIFKVQLANGSPGGYCLEWSAGLPGDTRSGDLVSLKEEQSRGWVLAVIRWISQLENARTLVGLELLSPQAKPYGALIHRKTGEKSAPMRVLLLPEVKLVGQPHTLITPRAGFSERQKITLVREGEEYFIQLLRQITATASFAQFDFRYIKQMGEVLGEDRSGHLTSPYDSLWSKI